MFCASVEHEGVFVTLEVPVLEHHEEDGLCVVEIPRFSDRETRRDYAAAVAYVFCVSQGFPEIGLQLSETKIQRIGLEDARHALNGAIGVFFSVLHLSAEAIALRADSLDGLSFPFHSLRSGQKKLMQETYAAMRDRRNLFAHAPTGIGKTFSVLYPALKALKKGHLSKIFYLTPRQSLQPQIAEAFLRLQGKTPFLHSVTLTAKEKICPHGKRCEHTDCPDGELRRENLLSALQELFSVPGHLEPDTIRQVAQNYRLCPFELSLCASMYCDLILCDYNYVFDPAASLKRFAHTKEPYAILCDEAHNLVDRIRESFSAKLSPDTVAPLYTRAFSGCAALNEALKRLEKTFQARRAAASETPDPISFTPPQELAECAEELLAALLPLMSERSALRELAERIRISRTVYYEVSAFLDAFSELDSHYAVCSYPDGGAKILLVDPGDRVRSITRDFGMCVFFSATLSPKEYYIGMLGGSEEEFLDLPSPFDPEHFKVLSASISTYYEQREQTVPLAAQLILRATRPKVGNYMVFFPSFAYLDRVVEAYRRLAPLDLILCQTPQMSERARAEYLAAFSLKRRERLLGFAVLGGLFSEGVDLAGEKLLGELIFGVGMPPPSEEAEAVKRRFDDREENGTALGYIYPGFNRVLQSAGRVIRTPTDRGFLVLCDGRYETPAYRELLPQDWQKPALVASPEELERQIRAFWEAGDAELS